MSREMEFSKKMVLVRKLVREGLLSDSEYRKVRRKLMDAAMVLNDGFLPATRVKSTATA